MNLKELLNSKVSHKAMMISASIAVLIFVFSAGVFVGIEKAKFSYGWGENYFSNFAGSSSLNGGPFTDHNPFWDKNYINPHGLLGQIIEIDDDGFIMTSANQIEMSVQINQQTIIKNHRDNLKFSDLKIGNQVIVIGEPGEQGEVDARFIRINNN
jgi:hypothetical protein